MEESQGRQISRDDFVVQIFRHESRIRSFVAVVMGGVGDEVDDVVQNSCLVAWQKCSEFRYTGPSPDEEFLRWVCTIARYKALDVVRARSSSKLVFDAELVEKLAQLDLASGAAGSVRAAELSACIERLRQRDRRLIELRYSEQRSVSEISAIVNRTADGVYKALARIRARLHACVEARVQSDS